MPNVCPACGRQIRTRSGLARHFKQSGNAACREYLHRVEQQGRNEALAKLAVPNTGNNHTSVSNESLDIFDTEPTTFAGDAFGNDYTMELLGQHLQAQTLGVIEEDEMKPDMVGLQDLLNTPINNEAEEGGYDIETWGEEEHYRLSPTSTNNIQDLMDVDILSRIYLFFIFYSSRVIR